MQAVRFIKPTNILSTVLYNCVILQLQYDDIPTTYLVLPVEIVKAFIYNASLDIPSLMYLIFQPINDQDIRPS